MAVYHLLFQSRPDAQLSIMIADFFKPIELSLETTDLGIELLYLALVHVFGNSGALLLGREQRSHAAEDSRFPGTDLIWMNAVFSSNSGDGLFLFKDLLHNLRFESRCILFSHDK